MGTAWLFPMTIEQVITEAANMEWLQMCHDLQHYGLSSKAIIIQTKGSHLAEVLIDGIKTLSETPPHPTRLF